MSSLHLIFWCSFSAMGMAQAAMGFSDVGKAKSAVQNIFPIIDRKPLIGGPDEGEVLEDGPEKVAGAISFVDINFCYPSRLDVTVFKSFSLEVAAGKVCAQDRHS
jgi:ATP-binding cassette subfamily B (MDR/TAP) protein 1